ncbi:MAG: response regulator transcription factor [Ardenticatenaceae bacterium]|nr:response regulator transcription factor [Ardenticatenaceae bacterium]
MTQKRQTRIILADDHNVVRRGLAALLTLEGDYQVVGETHNGEDLLTLVERHRPDIVILDLSMPRLNGLEALRRLKRMDASTSVLILSMYDDEELIVQAIRRGAEGYILKDSMDDELFEALEIIQQGGRYISRAIDPSVLNRAPSDIVVELTSREHEVLQLIAAGHTAGEIADLMSISPHTANRHRANLMQKMGVRNQIELVRLAIQRGLVIIGNRPLSN